MNQSTITETRQAEARLGWLALALTPQMGPTRSARAVQRLGGAERVFAASLTELEGAGLPAEAAQFCFDGRAREAALKEAAHTAEQQAGYLTPEDEAYPQRLLEIYDPPPVLWVRGNRALLNRAGIAVVGTRQPSPYGSGMAEIISRDLARRGVVVMSGMARGVDTCAHKGALDAGGSTVAVWGTGIDVIYPKENKKLAEQIVAQGGAIVTEFPHRALRAGAGARCVCGAWQRDQQECLGTEHSHQTGCEADGDVGGHLGGLALAGARAIGGRVAGAGRSRERGK